jgi:CRP-like cAMP-binding protein
MDAGERNRRGWADRELEAIGLLAKVGRRGRRRLDSTLERARVPAGERVAAAGVPVHWIAFVVAGHVHERGDHGVGRRWSRGDAVGLAEALRRDVAPADIVATTDAELLFLGVRELCALAADEPAFALALARHVAGEARPPKPESRRRRRRTRRFEPHRAATRVAVA